MTATCETGNRAVAALTARIALAGMLIVATGACLPALARMLGRDGLARALDVSSAEASCPVTGSWLGSPAAGNFRWNLREDAANHIEGAAPVIGGLPGEAALGISGQRNGDAIAFTFLLNGTGLSFTGTMTDCDTIQAQVIGLSFTMVRQSASYCGDGVTDAGEDCDDGFFLNGDTCTVACTPAACGNRITEPGEQCDDGNLIQADGCSNDCQSNVCGNGTLEPGEVCDDHNQVNGDGCSRTCQTNTCGNGVVESGEQCDDSMPPADGDQCSHLCQFEGCDLTGSWSDGFSAANVWNIHEAASGNLSGTVVSGGQAAGAFTITSGNRTGSEVNFVVSVNGSSAFVFTGTMTTCNSATLTFSGPTITLTRLSTGYCGDLTTDDGEECDDGNFSNGDDCTVACMLPECGNRLIEDGEACDDGNSAPADGCSNDCRVNHCGDGSNPPEPGEECDDGNATDGDGCSALCRRNTCGNSIIEPGEECDDGADDDGDGCSHLCQFEGCPVTGVWLLTAGVSPDAARWVEAPDGTISGLQGTTTSPTPSFEHDGARVGSVINLDLTAAGSPTPFASFVGALSSCDQLSGTLFLGGNPFGTITGTRISTGNCGDGVKQGGEQCDDGNTAGDDDCNFACRLSHCGNGAPNPGEVCDDGNGIDTDGCKNDCTPNVCGDGIAATTEGCDDGNTSNTDSCKNDCTLNVCGDGFVLATVEECDDGNGDPSDGCDATCNTEKLQIVALPASGGTVSTDAEGDGATPDSPVEAAVVVPPLAAPGVVAVAETTPTSPTAGYQTLGKQINITAPVASAANPLKFVFDLDASQIPVDQDETTLVVFRNGTPVPSCLGAVQATPFDPCVTARARLGDGDVRLTVLTSHASEWNVAAKLPLPSAAQSACRAEIRRRVTTAFGQRRDALSRCNDLVRKGKVTAPCPDAAAAEKIAKAEGQLDADDLVKKCPASLIPTLGLRGACAGAATPQALSTCLVDEVGAASDAAIAAEYGQPATSIASSDARSCQAAIATSAGRTYAFKRLKLFTACQKNLDKGKVAACLDAKAHGTELGAASKAAAGITRKCSDAQLADIGQLGGGCAAATTVGAVNDCELARHGRLTDALLTLVP